MKQIPSQRANANLQAVQGKSALDIPEFDKPKVPIAIPEDLYESIQEQNNAAKANTDPRFVSIDLPSNFIFYPFKTISVKPIGLNQQRKLSRGFAVGSMKIIIEAINTCIDQDIYQLTIGDFWYLMFWLKINSFKKSTWKIKYECESPEHIQGILEKKFDPESLTNTLEVTNSIIKEHQLKITEEELQGYLESLDVSKHIHLYVATVQDLVEGDELLSLIEQNNDEESSDDGVSVRESDITDEDDTILKYASVLSREYGATLKERIQYLINADLSADSASELDEYIAKIDHGVEELVETSCIGCGTSKTVRLSLDVLTFLPALW